MSHWKRTLALCCLLASLAGCGATRDGGTGTEAGAGAEQTTAAAAPVEGKAAPAEQAVPETAEKLRAETGKQEQPAPEASAETTLVLNELGEVPSAALDYALSEVLETRSELWSLDTILDYWGFNPLPTAVPEDLAPTFDETSQWKYAQVPEEGLLWDQFAFRWEDPSDAIPERQLTVTVATEEIFDDCFLVFSEDMLPSQVGGVEMLAGTRQMPYGPYTDGPDGEKIPAGTYPCYEAQFQYQGLYFQVESYDLTEAEFTAVLLSMVS